MQKAIFEGICPKPDFDLHCKSITYAEFRTNRPTRRSGKWDKVFQAFGLFREAGF